MYDDPVVAEIRKYRQEHAAIYDYDLKKFWEALRQDQKVSSKKVIQRGPKLLKKKTGS